MVPKEKKEMRQGKRRTENRQFALRLVKVGRVLRLRPTSSQKGLVLGSLDEFGHRSSVLNEFSHSSSGGSFDEIPKVVG